MRRMLSGAVLFALLFAVAAVQLCAAVPAAPVAESADCVVLERDFRHVDLTSRVRIARDPAVAWDLAEARRQTFAALSRSKIGYSDGAVWAHLCIVNRGDADRALVFDTGDKYFTYVDLFAVARAAGEGSEAVVAHRRAGIWLPFAERDIAARNVVFPLTIGAGQTLDLYVGHQAQAELRIKPELYDSTAFTQVQHRDDIVIYAFYGALAALFIYNLLLALTSRESSAVSCVVLIGSWAMLAASWDGVMFQWWPESLGFYRISYFYLIVPAVLISLAIFTVEYLQLRQLGRCFLWPQYGLIALALTFLPLALVLPTPVLRACIIVLFGLTLLCAIVTGLVLLGRGNGYAGVYLIGYFIMFASLIVAARFIYTPARGYDEVELWVRLAILAPISIFCLGVGYRIHQLKVTAAESQQRARLARAEAEFKSRFLVTMSHEIRTPLNGVVGMIELLQGTPLSDLQRRYVDVIHSSGRALMEVINDVLDFSKLEHGKVRLEIIGFDLERLVDDCIDVFAITKKSGAVVFNACIEPGTPLLVMGDPTRTRQVLINLVGNAFKFTQAGEVNLTIRLEPVASGQPRFLRFEINDTGIGMDSEAQRQLFSAFTQADGSISRRYGGTGLGLAICKQLVELMGGSIGVDSQQGVGSTFWFTLPLRLPPTSDIAPSLARAPALAGKRVLVLDDHDAFCHTMRVALESFGMSVTVAQTAAAARVCLAEATYDVWMIDRCLPDQDGLDLARELYAACKSGAYGGKAPPILLVSVAVDILDDETLRRAGVVAHLIKPISLSSLHDRLARLFGEPQQWPAPDIELAESLGGSLHVLVAEDNHINQIVLGGLLGKLGIAAVFVDDGSQAVDRYVASLAPDARPFDVIIMDCEMPVLDGYAATEQIREYESHHGVDEPVRIVGLTAHAVDEYRERAFVAGMDDFLTKPVHVETLRKALAQALMKEA